MEQGQKPIPNRLRKYRELRGLRLNEVARLLELYDPKPISMWEKGIATPSAVNLLKLSIIYRTFANELYHEHCAELKDELKALEFRLFQTIEKDTNR